MSVKNMAATCNCKQVFMNSTKLTELAQKDNIG